MTYPGQSFGDPGSATRNATVVLDANVSGYSQQMGDAAQQTNALAGSVGTLQSKLGGMDKWAGRKLFHVAASDFAVLGAATTDAATFEKQLSTLAATSAVTGTSLKAVKAGVEDATSKFPTSRGDVVALTEAITNLGVTGAQQVSSLTQTFIKLGAATGESSVGLAQGLTQLSRLMGVTDATQIGNMANSLLTVSKNAGVSATGVLSFAQAIAPMARQAGIGEAAVLGISTAFSKAGADGYVAANTFNSMVSDITQLISSGSPDLAKYANLIGVTVDQFKHMDKTSALSEIFTTLTKEGPGAVNTLNQLGIAGGVRAQSAIAAVTQSGDLQSQITTALGAQGNQNNLNKGAHAAFDNLADSLARLRNSFTEFGTVIGTTFLKPLTMATNLMGGFTRTLTGVLHPISAVVGVGGAVGGVLAGAGGIAMNAAGLIGTVALAKMVGRGTHVASFTGGMNAQRNIADTSKLSPRDAESMERYATGKMTGPQAFIYHGGLAVGKVRGPVAAPPEESLTPTQQAIHATYSDRSMEPAGRRLYRAGAMAGRGAKLRGEDATHAARYASGTMSPEDRELYEGGHAYGAASAAQTNPLRQAGTYRNLLISSPFRALNALNTGTATMLRESTTDAWDRVLRRDAQPRMGVRERMGAWVRDVQGQKPLDVLGKEAIRSANVVGGTAGAYTSTGAVQLGNAASRLARYGAPTVITSLVGGFMGVPHAGTLAANAIRRSADGGTAGEAATRLGAAGSQSMYALGTAVRHPIQAMGILATSAKEAALAVKDLAIKGAVASAGMAAGGAFRVASAVTGAAWSLTKSVGRMATSPVGMVGLAAGTYAYSKFRDEQKQVDLTQFLNPVQKYNDMLGTTTSNLANFDQALSTVTNGALGLAQTISQAMTVSAQTVTTAPNKPVVSAWSALGKDAGTDAHVAMLGSMQITDAKQLIAAQQDMIATGMTQSQVQAVMDAYKAQGGPSSASGLLKSPDYGLLGQKVVGTEGHGLNFSMASFNPFGSTESSESKSGPKIAGAAMSGIEAQKVTDTAAVNAPYAAQQALMSYSKFFAPEVGALNKPGHKANATREALSRELSKLTGGGYGGYSQTIADQSHGVNLGDHMSEVDEQQQFIKILQSTNQGRNYLSKLTGVGGTLDPNKFHDKLVSLSNTSDGSDFNSLLRKRGGALGRYAASNANVQSAIGEQQDNPGKVRASIDLLVHHSMKLTDGFSSALAELSKFQGAIGDTTSVLYKQVTAAQQLIAENQQNAQPFQSRATNFHQAIRGYSEAKDALALTPIAQQTPEQIAFVDSQKQNYETQLATQQQYQTSMYESALQFGVQMERAQEDMYGKQGQLARSREDFYISQLDAQQDFQRSTERSTEDFNRTMTRQAESSSQSIYNPYARVQSQYVTDAGTLSQNLADQNQRIALQQKQLQQAKSAGLSQQSIDTLQLSDPNNAQQLNSIIGQIVNDPALVKKINAQVGTRVTATTKLTQSSFNESYRNTVQDFTVAMNRAAQDYATAQDRADRQQSISLERMTQDYNKQVRRAGDDLTQAMTEVTGSFGQMYDKTMGQIARSVQKFSPAAAAQMTKDLAALVTQFPFLMNDDSQWGGTRTTPQDPGGGPGGALRPGIDKPIGTGKTYAHAAGGISTFAHRANISEGNQAEAIIPLDARGLRYMSDFMSGVTRELVQRMFTSGLPGVPTGTASGAVAHISEDHSTNFTGPVRVEASDPSEMARKLAAAARLKKLASPAHAH